jgi:conjugative relaxase-like TrwC/TraI family protein
VISVAVLRGGAAAGYYVQAHGCEHELVQDLTRSREAEPSMSLGADLGYYVNGRDLPGRWIGGGSRALGLAGACSDADGGRALQELLEGRHDGQALVAPVWRRDDTGARVDVRRAGFDVTFSAPKSVSTLMALADPDTVGQVMAAHEHAVTEALGLLERLAARVARGHQGDGQRAPRIASNGMVGAAFTHTTSRALDPQLHTHVVLANLAQGTDGRWSALDSRTLHREATTASYLYQHLLRAQLTQRLGVAWTDVDRGVAEIDGVPLPVRREFTTRRRQIEAALTRRGVKAGAELRGRARQLAARAACLATRPIKRHAAAAELRQWWAERAAAAGFSTEDLAILLARPTAEPVVPELEPLAARVLAADGVTREQSTFGQGALLRELITHLPPGAAVSTNDLLATTAALVRSDEVVPVLTGDGRAYTTRDLLTTEAQTLALAARSDQVLGTVDKARVAAAVARASGLRPEQQRVAFAILTSGRPVEVIAGPAGCGKTAGLAVATRTWHDAGVEVAGIAVAALTAQGLEAASGAPSVSLARALAQPERHLPSGGVLLVDEAGMTGTRQLHQILTAAAERACKVVLVGDPEQLPELEAGGMFARLAKQPAAHQLAGHHRQQHQWERDALQALRDGDITTALAAYRECGRLHTHHDQHAVHAQAVAAYLDARSQSHPWQTVLLAPSRDDVRLLNDHVRHALVRRGQLGKKALQVDTDNGPVDYRVGDQVLITRNDHRRGLLNGTTATITRLDRDGLTLQTADGESAEVDRAWLAAGQLDHGYAMTLHKAQGRTVHTALVVGSDSLSAQAGYVGLSRGTHANHLFLSSRDLHELTTDCGSRVQHLRAEATHRRGALTRDSRQHLATDWSTAQPRGRQLS